MEGFNGKRKLTINLSVLFTNLADSFALPSSVSSLNGSSNYGKSPRIFQNTSVVGLSIVAAMMTKNAETDLSSSRPIPIVSSPSSSSSAGKKPPGVVMNSEMEPSLDHHHHREAFVDELSESYTCVISHFNGDHNSVQKRVFFDYADAEDIFHGDDDKTTDHGVFFASSSPMNVGSEIKTQFWSRDFLSSCFLCTKKLHGLDIFMYRGEKAFCSAECRDKHIRSDDLKETCGSEARKQLDCSMSPCSGPQPIFTGVVAA